MQNKRINYNHGYVGTSTYRVWLNMKSRCNNTNHPDYKSYGGRGIKYIEKWDSFLEFLQEMGERPQGLSLDRINNNGNYCKENCRWSTFNEQQSNKRKTNPLIAILRQKDVRTLKCKRCDHSWYPRAPKAPKVCPNPKCKSPYWNKQRQNENIKTVSSKK